MTLKKRKVEQNSLPDNCFQFKRQLYLFRYPLTGTVIFHLQMKKWHVILRLIFSRLRWTKLGKVFKYMEYICIVYIV